MGQILARRGKEKADACASGAHIAVVGYPVGRMRVTFYSVESMVQSARTKPSIPLRESRKTWLN